MLRMLTVDSACSSYNLSLPTSTHHIDNNIKIKIAKTKQTQVFTSGFISAGELPATLQKKYQ